MAGFTVYEVAIVNQEVCDAVSEGRRHPNLSDSWAEVNYFEIKAMSKEDARKRMANRYPPSQGYVIKDISEDKYAD